MENASHETFPRDPRLRGTRGELLGFLRRKDSTVADLGQALGLTTNAVRQHLAGLERDRLVEHRGSERGVSKPSRRYGLTAAGRLLFARGHGPVMRALFEELLANHPAGELQSALERTGRRLAEGRVTDQASFAERLDAVRQAFQELGGDPVVEESERGVILRIHHCPLGDVTAAHPETCVLAQAMVSGITGARVEGHCAHGERPSCAFELPRPGNSSAVE